MLLWWLSALWRMVLAPVLVRPINPRSHFRQFWDTVILACVLCVAAGETQRCSA